MGDGLWEGINPLGLVFCDTPITPIVSFSSPSMLARCTSLSSKASTGTVEATEERW